LPHVFFSWLSPLTRWYDKIIPNFSASVNETNQTNKTNQIDQTDQIDQINQIDERNEINGTTK